MEAGRRISIKTRLALAHGRSAGTIFAVLYKDLGLLKKSARWVPRTRWAGEWNYIGVRQDGAETRAGAFGQGGRYGRVGCVDTHSGGKTAVQAVAKRSAKVIARKMVQFVLAFF
jgi:hypothetical protein